MEAEEQKFVINTINYYYHYCYYYYYWNSWTHSTSAQQQSLFKLQQNRKVVFVPICTGNENIMRTGGKAPYILNLSIKWLWCVVSFIFRLLYLWGRQMGRYTL